MQTFKTVLFQSCFLCFLVTEISFFFPSFLCVLNATPQTPPQKFGLRWLLVLILPAATSAPFSTCCQGAFVCVRVCVCFLDQQSFLLKWSLPCVRFMATCPSLMYQCYSVSSQHLCQRRNSFSEQAHGIIFEHMFSIKWYEEVSFPSMWRLKWRACLKTDCAKSGVCLNSMSTLLTWKYIINW